MARRNAAWRLSYKTTHMGPPETARHEVKRLVREPPRPVLEEEAGEPVHSWTYEPVDPQELKGITPVPARRNSWRRSIPSPHVF